MHSYSFVLAGLTLLSAGSTVSAQQFLLFDTTFTYTKEHADNSKPSKSCTGSARIGIVGSGRW